MTEELAWFGENLVTPDRFNRSKSKGFYRRTTRGIAWFKDSATECLSRMHRMRVILEKYGHPVMMLTETRIGYVVYEDENSGRGRTVLRYSDRLNWPKWG